MDSDYCYSMEMERAIKRYEDGEAYIIPIIIRTCEWKYSPLGKFKVLPNNKKAVNTWNNRDEAFHDIVQGIRRVVISLREIKVKDKVSFKNVDSISITKPSDRREKDSIKTTRLVQKRIEDRSLGKKTQEILKLIINNFSFGEVKKRARGFFSLALLFLFTVLNIIALPYLIYWWANSLIWVLSLFFLGILFLMGITNKNGVAAYSVTVAFFVIWTFIGSAGAIGYYHLALPLYWLIIIILLLSLLQLVLFRPRSRKRRSQRIF